MEKQDLKSKHEQVIEAVTKVASVTTKLGIVHCNSQDTEFDGRHVTVDGEKLLFFGSCGYLGLEKHPALVKAGIEALQTHGVQFASSRAYISSVFYQEAESLFAKMFDRPSLLFQSLTLGHITNLPLLVGDGDAVIIDIRAHDSIQSAASMLKLRQIHIEVIRHSRMDMLEERIKVLKNRFKKIWYLADGVYSMHGDFVPIKQLYALADKYEQLHMYIDDIHGMGWTGPMGTGMVMAQAPYYHRKLFLTTGLSKSFGTTGGVLVFPDEDYFKLVKTCGRGFIFSIQMPPSALASTIASCKLHMSPEIYDLQSSLKEKIDYFNKRAEELGLLLINKEVSPVFFIGIGKPEAGYEMVLRLKKLGYFFNLSVFPAVSLNHTGLRITLSNHLTIDDIEGLLTTIAENFTDVLKVQNTSFEEVKKAFEKH